MSEEAGDRRATGRARTRTDYMWQTLQAALTIWLSLIVVSIVAFGLSENLRLAGVESNQTLLISFLVALGLILLALWLLPRPFLTLKAEPKGNIRQSYINSVLQLLAIIWAILALVILAAIALYAALSRAGTKSDQTLLISFLVALGLILLALWLLPRPFLTLKAGREDGGDPQ